MASPQRPLLGLHAVRVIGPPLGAAARACIKLVTLRRASAIPIWCETSLDVDRRKVA